MSDAKPTLPKSAPKFIDAQTIVERIENTSELGDQLSQDPGDVLAEARLEAIYRSQGNWFGVIELLIDRAASSGDLGSLREVAAIYEHQLGDLESARVVSLAAFEREPQAEGLADALDSLAHRTGQWEEVIDAYMIAAGKTAEELPATSSELWLRIACAHLVTSGDMEAVTEALGRIRYLNVEPLCAYLDMVESRVTTLAVLDTLIELYRRIGDDDRRTRSLSRAIAMATDGSSKARYHLAIGDLAESGGDRETASWHYTESLRRDPRSPGARDALVKIYRDGGKHEELAKLLASSRFTASQTERASVALEAASIYADELDENTRAINLYAFAFSQDPGHVDAALPLAERYYAQKRWDELGPILDLLISRGGDLGPHAPDLGELHQRRAECEMALGEFEAALEHADLAFQLDSRSPKACRVMADALSELGRSDAACDAYNQLLVLQRADGADAALLASTLAEMARTRCAALDDDGATTLFESALDLAFSRDTFAELKSVYERIGRLGGLLACAEFHLRNQSISQRDQVMLQSTIAEICSRQGDAHRAIECYERAHELDPENRSILHQLVEYYSAAEMWEQAVHSIRKAAALESETIRRGKYLQAAATLARHHLDIDRVRELSEQALDCFFVETTELAPELRASCMRAFSDLARALHGSGEFKALERAYRQMIRRMRAGDAELPELWHGLGQVYRKHLRKTEEAIQSFEVASALDSDRETHQNILIDLYRKSPTISVDQIDRAIERRQRLVAHEPFVAAHYRELHSLYSRSKRSDEAWTAMRALVYLNEADEEEVEEFGSQRSFGGIVPHGQLSPLDWAELRNENEDPGISTIMALASEAIAREAAQPARKLGLRDDPNPMFGHLRRMFVGVTSALGLPGHELCIQPEIQGDVVLANVRRGGRLCPTFAIGRSLYDGRSVEAITYNLGRSLTYGRPEYLLRLILAAPAELEAVFLAASSLSRGDVPVSPALAPLVARYQTTLAKRLRPEWKRALAAAVESFVAAGRPFSLETWGHSVDATARRAGLLLSGDLGAAADSFQREPHFAAGVAPKEKLASLLVHSVSPVHQRLRMKLGLAIPTNDIARSRRMAPA